MRSRGRRTAEVRAGASVGGCVARCVYGGLGREGLAPPRTTPPRVVAKDRSAAQFRVRGVKSDAQRPLKQVRFSRADESVISDGWPDAEVSQITSRQRTLITRGQLVALGVHPRSIDRALARGRLSRVHAGVYSLVAATVRPRWAAETAAVLAYGEPAVLSHATAARVHGITLPGPTTGPIHVTLVGVEMRSRRSGILLHSTNELHPQERVRVSGLPVTSVARTVIDLAPTQTPRGRELLVDQARKRSRTKLIEALDRHPGRPGTPEIRRLLDPARPSSLVWSEGEERLRRLLVRAGVPLPESNVELYAGYTPDLLWREQQVIVEYDSDEWHAESSRRAYDTTRQNRLTADGYIVIPVTCEQLADHPEEVLVWIVRALFRG